MANTAARAGLNRRVKIGVAFYAPLKSPSHPNPSGDRKIARLFIRALEQAGYHVELASQLRSFDKAGDVLRQQRLIDLAKKEAGRIMRRWHQQSFTPQAWFTYHLYYKAPDLIGPIICQSLNIPYIVAEASWAEKRAVGGWALYHQQVATGLKLASKVVCINPRDKIALTDFYDDFFPKTYAASYTGSLVKSNSPLVSLNAFIDDLPVRHSSISHSCIPHKTTAMNKVVPGCVTRQDLADLYGLDINLPWLITIAMMRSGDKFSSYQQLSTVVDLLQQPYQLLIIGEGVMQPEVQALFTQHKQVKFAGAVENSQIRQLLPHFELLVWPAINEALGMIFLEAQQAGVAVVAGDQGGVSSIVSNNVTGILVDAYDASALSLAVDNLLTDPAQLNAMKQAAIQYVALHHSIDASALQLKLVIEEAIYEAIESTDLKDNTPS
ncbi:glycosyltransferase family 4 protein [Moritella sp. F3]|uniref:glycosyltransferase family 4 protein n=1 Tax=Moritella sp. F3 TaxID=2718882 RepID=UPI001A25B071|nr:glycosyltransferase family 4 protein [Moritella sp. F3]GIC75808.1 glycosyl transferase family 1 [Moritella sp. F1]GIC81743.1 glycosyl transferase family 1 [Moritella sp. F3]